MEAKAVVFALQQYAIANEVQPGGGKGLFPLLAPFPASTWSVTWMLALAEQADFFAEARRTPESASKADFINASLRRFGQKNC